MDVTYCYFDGRNRTCLSPIQVILQGSASAALRLSIVPAWRANAECLLSSTQFETTELCSRSLACPTPRNPQLRFRAISIQQTLQRQRPGASSTPPSGGRSPWQRPEQKRKRADSRWSRPLFSGVAFTRADGDIACIRSRLSVRFKRQSHTTKGV